MYFRNYRLPLSSLDHSLKSAVSEHASTLNMWERRKCFLNFYESVLSRFFIILSEVDLENVSPSVRWNVRGVC